MRVIESILRDRKFSSLRQKINPTYPYKPQIHTKEANVHYVCFAGYVFCFSSFPNNKGLSAWTIST